MAWKARQSQLKNLAEGLVKAGALQFGTFTLPDGRDTPYFINLRGLPSYPGVYKLVVDAMTSLASAKAPKVKAVCGIPMMGTILGSPVSLALGKPFLYTRLARRANERALEGELRPGWDVLLLDDLATTGKTLLRSVSAVRQEGGEVKHAAVLIDRLEGARERLAKEGVSLHAVTDILELADILVAIDLIEEHDLKSITKAVGGRQ